MVVTSMPLDNSASSLQSAVKSIERWSPQTRLICNVKLTIVTDSLRGISSSTPSLTIGIGVRVHAACHTALNITWRAE